MHNVAQLRRLRQYFPDDLVVIGVHSAKFPSEKLTENIREAILRHDIEHPVVNDAGFKTWNAYNIHAWPTVVLIDQQGKITGSQSGEIEAEEFIPIIERMISDFDQRGELDRTPLVLEPEAAAEPLRPLSYPSKLLVTPDGRIFVADSGHHRILEMSYDPAAISARIERVFGSGLPAFKDGMPEEAAFHHPRGLAIAGETLYVADTDNHAIRAIDLEDGSVRTVAGTGELGRGRFVQGAPTEVPLRSPWALLALEEASEDRQNVLFIAMAGTHQIWLLLGEERIGVFAGSGQEALVDGPLEAAGFNQPSDLALGLGHLLVADAEASAIRAISLGEEPKVITLVGQGLFEYGDVDGTGAEVRLQHPAGIAFSNVSNEVYIADSYNHKIKRLDPTQGLVKTLVGTGEAGMADGPFGEAGLYQPEGIVFYEGRLFIADTNNHLLRVADLATNTLHTLTLRGLEQVTPPAFLEKAGNAARTIRLEEVTVAPGQVTFTFDFLLPAGHKLNPDAPSTISGIENCDEVIETEEALPIPAEQWVTFSTVVEEDCDLSMEITLYYCQSEEERVCMIHDRKLILPVKVAEEAADNARVTYSIEA